MKRPLRLVVIGGVAAGTKAAAKARREDPTMDITIITEEKYISYAGCGLAYYVGGIVDDRKKLFARSPEHFQEKQNITVLLRHHADRIDTYDHTVLVTSLEENKSLTLPYDRLLIATGARAVTPPIPGIGLAGVHTLHTIPDADALREQASSGAVKTACIIGGGYIGLEAAENLARLGIGVTIIEQADTILAAMLDPDMAKVVTDHLTKMGVSVKTGVTVHGIEGAGGNVTGLVTEQSTFPCEMVVVATGVVPAVELASDARITLGPTGAIKVDSRLSTSIKNIYAAGDCAESTHLVSKKPCWYPLGSTANKQGRVAGANIAGGKKSFPGVLGTTIVKVFDLAVARTGLSEQASKEAGFNPVTVTITTPARPGYYPGGGTVTLKLVADRGSKRPIGGQIIGDASVDKVVDTLAAALMGKLTLADLTAVDLAYSPPYAPALGTLIVAAGVLDEKIAGITF